VVVALNEFVRVVVWMSSAADPMTLNSVEIYRPRSDATFGVWTSIMHHGLLVAIIQDSMSVRNIFQNHSVVLGVQRIY